MYRRSPTPQLQRIRQEDTQYYRRRHQYRLHHQYLGHAADDVGKDTDHQTRKRTHSQWNTDHNSGRKTHAAGAIRKKPAASSDSSENGAGSRKIPRYAGTEQA